MDIISFNESATANGRIENFIEDPDSTSGIVTVPSTIASGETITIPAGRTAILPNVQIDGTLNVEGEVFIPSGSTLSTVVEKVTSTDNAIVRFDGITGEVQNSGVIIDDNNNVNMNNSITNTFTAYGIGGVNKGYIGDSNRLFAGSVNDFGIRANNNLTFGIGSSEKMRLDSAGNVGIGLSTPKARLDIYTLGISGGLPATTGNAADPNVMARIAASAVCMDIGVEPAGQQWIQCRGISDYSLKYDLHLQPNGGNVLVTGTGALGYGTGSGGTVTQATSKTNAVTLNKPSGKITMNNAALAAGAYVGFAINNSILSSTDGIIITQDDNGLYLGANYDIKVVYKINGVFIVIVKNISTGSLSDTVTFRFDIIKGAIA